MKLTLRRFEYSPTCTVGTLWIGGRNVCYTLEDRVRQVNGSPVSEWKVAGQTAIPRGVYSVVVDHSKRFGRLLPRLVGVECFEGVRIHSGNTDKDTEGCILVGRSYHGGDCILESRPALAELMAILSKCTEPVTIEVI